MIDELTIGGRRYVTINKASAIVHYDPNSIRYWLRSQPDLIAWERRNGRVFVCLSDLLAFARAREQDRSKWQQITDWWETHVQERDAISDTYDFHRRLVRAGIKCSPSLARWFIAKRRPTVPKSHLVLAWLEVDPARRHLPLGDARRQAQESLRIDLSRNCVKRARKLYDARHGEHRPPFDMARYLSTKDAAELVGGIHWRDTLYVPRASLEKRFGNGWLRRSEAAARLRAWFRFEPQRLDLVASAAHRAFCEETGVEVSRSAIYAVRHELRTERAHSTSTGESTVQPLAVR